MASIDTDVSYKAVHTVSFGFLQIIQQAPRNKINVILFCFKLSIQYILTSHKNGILRLQYVKINKLPNLIFD